MPPVQWDDAAALQDPVGGAGWPGEVEVRLGARQPLYQLDRASLGGLGFEGEILLGWRGGDAIAADVSDPEAVAEMFRQVADRHRRLDVLVNNAGISGMEDDPERVARYRERSMKQMAEAFEGREITTHLDIAVELEDEAWRRMIAVHLDGTFFCSREALKIMGPQLSGSIVNITVSWSVTPIESSPLI